MFLIHLLCYSGVLYLILLFGTDFRLHQLSWIGWAGIFVSYAVLAYVYAGFANDDILLYADRIEIVNRIPLFRKHYSFQIDQVESVKFRHEWTESFGKNIKPGLLKYIMSPFLATLFFPADYKWIKISTNKTYTFYCFGVDMDYYDNNGPIFEDLFNKLAEKGVNVSWTDTPDTYYSHMEKNKGKNRM